MSLFAVLLFCVQACLVQNLCQACPGASIAPARASPCGLAGRASAFGLASGLAYDGLAYPAAGHGAAAYGGIGEGTVAVAGELPVVGKTAVAGQVPIMGAVSFNGPAAAAGAVSISGKCACGAEVADVKGLAAPCRLAAPTLTAPCGWSAPAWDSDRLAYSGAGFAGRSLAYDGIYAPAMEFSPTSGGALPVSSHSAIAPAGISVMSDNAYEGMLAVDGELPFVGTVGLEGVMPSAGVGAVNHACGNGRTAMISETAAFAPSAAMAPLAAYGPGAAFAPAARVGSALRGGWASRGCGCSI